MALLNSARPQYPQSFPGMLFVGLDGPLVFHALPPSIRFAFGAVLCLGLSWAAMRWIAPLGWMDIPRGRRQHEQPTPRTGGLALLLTLGMGLAGGAVSLPLGWAEWSLVFAMGLMGTADDRFDLRARWKALASLAAGAILAWLTWGVLRGAGQHLPLFHWQLATRTGLTLILLWAWYWSIPQACNLIDGLNGLAPGFFLMLALVLDFPSGNGGQGAYFLGALTTLALLNWPTGRQFLGDSGSLALGTLFAILGVRFIAVTSPNHLLWVFAYPIVDVLMVMAIRIIIGRPLGEGDRNHFHHQWLRALGGEPLAALLLTLAPAFACMQIVHGGGWHRLMALIGLAWLFGSAAWFGYRSTRVPKTATEGWRRERGQEAEGGRSSSSAY